MVGIKKWLFMLQCQVSEFQQLLWAITFGKAYPKQPLIRYPYAYLELINRDSGVRAIEILMQKKGKFDYILLETTGLASPGFVYFSFTWHIVNSLNGDLTRSNAQYSTVKQPHCFDVLDR
jgi:hypothetical protein